MAKLTKKQREFFDKFSRNILANTILMDINAKGHEVTDEVAERVVDIVSRQDVTTLSEAVGKALLEKVPFATLVKVEKFLNTDEAKDAMKAAQEVGAAVQDELYALVHEMFKVQTEEVAE